MSGHELVYRAVNQILLHFELLGKSTLLHFKIFKKEEKEGTHLLSGRMEVFPQCALRKASVILFGISEPD